MLLKSAVTILYVREAIHLFYVLDLLIVRLKKKKKKKCLRCDDKIRTGRSKPELINNANGLTTGKPEQQTNNYTLERQGRSHAQT